MLINIMLLVVGFIMLIKGADIFVDGASSLAGNFKISKIVIGLTIVAFGTSAPELAVSIKSLVSGSGDIVLGNVIGSNILNILLIIGVSSMFHFLSVKNNTVKKELPITILITTLLGVVLSDNLISGGNNSFTRSDGIIVLLFFAVFIYYLISMMRNKTSESDEKYMPLFKSICFTIVGILAIIFGSNFVVDSAAYLAKGFGVSEKMVALTVIALGTSLPELVTSITATRKGEYDIAIGNVVGSNIFNIGIVLGIPVAIFGGINHITFNYIDIVIMIISAMLLFIFSANDRKITRREGVIFLSLFIAYYTYVIVRA